MKMKIFKSDNLRTFSTNIYIDIPLEYINNYKLKVL